jgi:hypothetical protein
MNANAFCIRNRVFAMRVGDDLVLKLPPNRVAELVQAKSRLRTSLAAT